MSSNKSVPQSAMPSVALVTALSIFVTLIDWEEFLHGKEESKPKDKHGKKGTKAIEKPGDKHGKKEAKFTREARSKHRGVYHQNLFFCDMSPDHFWWYRKLQITMTLEWLVDYKTFPSPRARRRYIDNTFYYEMISHGPLATPRWYDCFLLFRSTPEWTNLVKELVKTIKELSSQECRWLLSILKMPWFCLDDKEKLPKSFLSHPVFYACVKKCMVDSRARYSHYNESIKLGIVKDVETYLEAQLGECFTGIREY